MSSPMGNLRNAESAHFTRPIYYEEGKKPCFPFYQLFSTDFPSFPSDWSPFDEFSSWMESICKTWIFILSTRNVAEICMDWLSHAGQSEHRAIIPMQFSKSSINLFERRHRSPNIHLIFLSFFPNLSWWREIKSNPRQKRKKEHCCHAAQH